MDVNKTDDVVFDDPKTWEARREVAEACCRRLDMTMPCAVDTIDNSVDEQYAAWPERIFVIDGDGRIAYAGAPGPWGFVPKDAERALKALLKKRP